MPFNFITLWKSEMKLKSFINCKSTCIYTITLFYDLSEIFGSTGDISIVDEGLQNLG